MTTIAKKIADALPRGTVSRRTEARIVELLTLRETIKRLHEEADDLETELIEETPVGERIPLSDGSSVVLNDNFRGGNTCFRPACVRQFEFIRLYDSMTSKAKK